MIIACLNDRSQRLFEPGGVGEAVLHECQELKRIVRRSFGIGRIAHITTHYQQISLSVLRDHSILRLSSMLEIDGQWRPVD